MMRIPTLVEVIAASFPGVECSCTGNPYSYADLVVSVGNAPTEQDLLAAQLHLVVERVVSDLSEACKEEIVGGFTSSALGYARIYDTSEEDQLNLLGSVTATSPDKTQYYGCRDTVTLVKTYELHTYSQLRQVLDEGAQWKLSLLQKFAVKRAQVEACNTIDEVVAIQWED